VGRWVQPGDQRGAGGGAGRVDAVSPVEARSLAGQPVQVRCPDPGVGRPQDAVMVLVGGDQENIGRGHDSFFSAGGKGRDSH
jgi:hypothetical protein